MLQVPPGVMRPDDRRRDQLSFAQTMLRGSFDPVMRGDDAMRDLLAQLDSQPGCRR